MTDMAQPGKKITRVRLTVEIEALGYNREEALQAAQRAAQRAMGREESRATLSEPQIATLAGNDEVQWVAHPELKKLAETMLAQAPQLHGDLIICTLRSGDEHMPCLARAVIDTTSPQALLMDARIPGPSVQNRPAAFQLMLDQQFLKPCRMLLRDWFSDTRRIETVKVEWASSAAEAPEEYELLKVAEDDDFAARALALLKADDQSADLG